MPGWPKRVTRGDLGPTRSSKFGRREDDRFAKNPEFWNLDDWTLSGIARGHFAAGFTVSVANPPTISDQWAAWKPDGESPGFLADYIATGEIGVSIPSTALDMDGGAVSTKIKAWRLTWQGATLHHVRAEKLSDIRLKLYLFNSGGVAANVANVDVLVELMLTV